LKLFATYCNTDADADTDSDTDTDTDIYTDTDIDTNTNMYQDPTQNLKAKEAATFHR